MDPKLAAHLNYFGLPRDGTLDSFWNMVSKNYHSRLEVSVKVVREAMFPGRFHLFYYLEDRHIRRAWADFREFVQSVEQVNGVRLNEGVLRRFEDALPRLTDAVQFAVGIDLRAHLPDSRIKFGLVGEPMGSAMQLFLEELTPDRFPMPLLRHVRTGGFELAFDGGYRLKLYPGFAPHEWSDALKYFVFSQPVVRLLQGASYFFVATHRPECPVQIELTRDQLDDIIPVANHPLYRSHERFVLGVDRRVPALSSLPAYNLYY